LCLKNHKKTWEEKTQPPSYTALYSLSWSLFLETQQNSKQEQNEKMLSGSSCSCCSEKIATTYTSSCSFISIFLCVSLITKLWFLAISSLSVFFSRNQEKKKTQEKQQGTKEKREKPSQVSPFTFSHEHNRRRDEEKPQNKKRKKKQTTNKNEHSEHHNFLFTLLLLLSLSLSLSHLANTPKELLQHFLTYSIFVWSEVLPVSYSPMCSFLLTSSHSLSPSLLPLFLSPFLSFLPSFR
jgi:cation transport ATPase